MIWTPQQDAALVAANEWLHDRNGPQVFRLFGYAGVGKTTLAVHLGNTASGTCARPEAAQTAPPTSKRAPAFRQSRALATQLSIGVAPLSPKTKI
jgi:hypothetical protein